MADFVSPQVDLEKVFVENSLVVVGLASLVGWLLTTEFEMVAVVLVVEPLRVRLVVVVVVETQSAVVLVEFQNVAQIVAGNAVEGGLGDDDEGGIEANELVGSCGCCC